MFIRAVSNMQRLIISIQRTPLSSIIRSLFVGAPKIKISGLIAPISLKYFISGQIVGCLIGNYVFNSINKN